jgi:hypothetical protein
VGVGVGVGVGVDRNGTGSVHTQSICADMCIVMDGSLIFYLTNTCEAADDGLHAARRWSLLVGCWVY